MLSLMMTNYGDSGLLLYILFMSTCHDVVAVAAAVVMASGDVIVAVVDSTCHLELTSIVTFHSRHSATCRQCRLDPCPASSGEYCAVVFVKLF